MTTAALIPLRSLHDGKRRLDGVLLPSQRMQLVQRLFQRAYAALAAFPKMGLIAVVSPDPAVLDWVAQFDVLPIRQPDHGLNQGLTFGRHAVLAQSQPAHLLVLLPDLPRITSEDIAALHSTRQLDSVVLAPDRHKRGTNALLLPVVAPLAATLPFRFGEDSLKRHQAVSVARGLKALLCVTPGLAYDVDTADDLAHADMQLVEPVPTKNVR